MAAATASRSAARTPAASRTRSPAAVVPPGDVTPPAAPRARRPTRRAGAPAPRIVCTARAGATSRAGRPARRRRSAPPPPGTRTPARSRTARSRRRAALSDPHDRADRAEDALGPRQVVVAGLRPAGDGGRTGPTSAGVFGIARTTAIPPPSAASRRPVGTPAAMDRTRPHPAAATAAQASSTSAGFTATTAPSAATGRPRPERPANRAPEVPARRPRLHDREVGRLGPAGGEEPGEQGLAHAAAATPPASVVTRASTVVRCCQRARGTAAPALPRTTGPSAPLAITDTMKETEITQRGD